MVDGKAREVIGVMPSNFRFLDLDPALIEPFQFDRSKIFLGNFSYQGVARLKPNISFAQADADAARMLPIVNRRFPPPPGFSVKVLESARITPELKPFKQELIGDVGTVLWVLMATIGIVLLIACANVANLLLVRGEARHLELAIRSALGAGWIRIAGELLFESVTLAAFGGAAGLLVAFGAVRLRIAMAPAGLPRLHEIGIDMPVLLFTLLVSLMAGLLFSSVPIFKYAGASLGTGLREGGRTLSQSRERHRARNLLVAGGAGAGTAHQFGTHDPHIPNLDARATRFYETGPAPDLLCIYSGSTGPGHSEGSTDAKGNAGQNQRRSRRILCRHYFYDSYDRLRQ
jgi:hypothetical protein